MSLYRIYFQRCHRFFGSDNKSPLANKWHDDLLKMHDSERASRGWKISKVAPTPELIVLVETPGSYSQWIVGLTSCLGFDLDPVNKIQEIATKYIHLSRLLDSVVDIEDDIKNDQWGGMTVRLALEGNSQADVERIILETAEECIQLWQDVEKQFSQYKRHPEDNFTLADILWAYLYS